MSSHNSTKRRVKLYKAGKQWLTAAIVSVGFFAGVQIKNVHADTSNNNNIQSTKVTDNNGATVTSGNSNSLSDDNTNQAATANIPSNLDGYTKQQDQDGNNVWKNNNGQGLNGWEATNDSTWYRFNNGSAVTGWQSINDNWYYMNKDNSAMETGIQKIDNNTYYFNTNHDGTYGAMKTGWQDVNNNWYHFNYNGAADTGWNNIDGNEYYFNKDNAQMATGDTLIDGYHFYFEPSSGHQLKGLVLDRNTHTLKYYDQNTGSRQITMNADGKTYTFNAQSGDLDTTGLNDGLNQIAGHTYFFNAASKTFVNNDWKQVNNKWYYFGENGDAVTGWFESGAKNWYYFNQDGAAQTGWFKSPAGAWYYFDQNNAWALKDWQKLDGQWYHFDPTNTWSDTGWFKSGAGNWYYLDPSNKGASKTGWFKSPAGAWYYFDQDNAWALKDWQKLDGQWYHFDPTNAWSDTGWFKSGAGNWYYLDPSNKGAVKTGWFKSAAGNWYYFDQNNAWALKGWQHINNAWYYFDPTETWADTGWQKINGKWYYFDPNEAWMLTGTHEINGKTYNFNSDGSWADGWVWPFPQDGEGHFSGAQLFGVHPGGEFRMNGFHDGLDFGSIDHPGREVHAIHGGTVKLVGYTAGLDWYAVVDTGEYLVVYQEAFANRSDIRVHEGQQISTGDVIGIRNTAHVHIGITRDHNFNRALGYSFTNNGTWLDPLQVIRNGINNC